MGFTSWRKKKKPNVLTLFWRIYSVKNKRSNDYNVTTICNSRRKHNDFFLRSITSRSSNRCKWRLQPICHRTIDKGTKVLQKFLIWSSNLHNFDDFDDFDYICIHGTLN